MQKEDPRKHAKFHGITSQERVTSDVYMHIMQKGASDREKVTPFKRAQLRHRRQGENPNRMDDLGDWIDFSQGPTEDNRIISLDLPDEVADKHIYKGPIFGLRGFPGLLFAPNALGEDVQNELAFQAVTKYCESPHKTNIDQCAPKANEEVDESMKMWEDWKAETNWQESSTKKKQKALHSGRRKYRSLKKLSWATMGYHYDWTERSYNKDLKSSMPSLVENISVLFARTSLVMDNEATGATNAVSYTASASIVNFYSTKSNMGGHRDDLEFAMDKPIVSMSVGLPAVFLLGGKTNEEEPVVSILVRSGDVLCMGGDSRLNYHGMARVLPFSVQLPERDSACCPLDADRIGLLDVSSNASDVSREDEQALDCFLSNHRININVRQVYHDSEDGAASSTDAS